MEHHPSGRRGAVDVDQVPQFSVQNALQMQDHDRDYNPGQQQGQGCPAGAVGNIGIYDDDDDGGLESLPSLQLGMIQPGRQCSSVAENTPILLNGHHEGNSAGDCSNHIYVDHHDTNSCPSDEGDTFTLNTLGGDPSIMTSASNVSLSRIYGSAATVDTSTECVHAFRSRTLTSIGYDSAVDYKKVSPNAGGNVNDSPVTSVDSMDEYIDINVPAGVVSQSTFMFVLFSCA